nr:DUF1667 domain-containing protein [Blautia obeum]
MWEYNRQRFPGIYKSQGLWRKICKLTLKGIEVPAPVHIGDVILKNVADTGVDIVATKNVE